LTEGIALTTAYALANVDIRNGRL